MGACASTNNSLSPPLNSAGVPDVLSPLFEPPSSKRPYLLHDAAQAGDIGRLDQLIAAYNTADERSDILYQYDTNGNTPLMSAIIRRQVASVRYLIGPACRCDPNHASHIMDSKLIGIFADSKRYQRDSSPDEAYADTFAVIIELLVVEGGWNVNTQTVPQPRPAPSSEQLIGIASSAPADANPRSSSSCVNTSYLALSYGISLLHIITRYLPDHSPRLAAILVQHGCSIDPLPSTMPPLFWAAMSNDEGLVQLLLDSGHDVASADRHSASMAPVDQQSPFMVWGLQPGMAMLFLGAGWQMDSNSENGGTVLTYLLQGILQGFLTPTATLSLLARCPMPDVDRQCADGRTALMLAVLCGEVEIVEMLVGRRRCDKALVTSPSSSLGNGKVAMTALDVAVAIRDGTVEFTEHYLERHPAFDIPRTNAIIEILERPI